MCCDSRWPNFFCGLTSIKQNLLVLKPLETPQEVVGSVEVWDRLLGFKILPLLGRVLSMAPSPQCKAPCNRAPCGLLVWGSGSCLLQSCCDIPACEVGTETPTSASLPRRTVRFVNVHSCCVCSAFPIYLLALMLSKPKKCFELVPILMGMSYKIFCSQMQTCLGCVLGWLDSVCFKTAGCIITQLGCLSC